MSDNQNTSGNSLSDNNGKRIFLTPQERKMFDFLAKGKTWSAKQLMIHTGDRDPRSTIRYLRNKGVKVADRWVRGGGTRYKHYFVPIPVAS